MLSDIGNKSVFERNQNNVNPERSVAAGNVLMRRKMVSTITQKNEEKEDFCFYQELTNVVGVIS